MMRVTDRYTFFFRPECPFSQWHPAEFVLDELTFCCTEQAMMYSKAILFGDTETAAEIMATTSPAQHKALGRKVSEFEEATWRDAREQIVYRANLAKFSQNPELHAALMATAGTTLVEASPTDRIWGIGLSVEDLAADDAKSWRGRNLLGQILTRVRDVLTPP